MSQEFKIEHELVLPASAEDVFAAITTGTAGWNFPTPPVREGKAPEGYTITAWEPPHHVAVRGTGPDGGLNALEHIIESRDGGTAVLHYVHSGIFVDDWENQYDGAAKHTDFYLHSLGQYLQYFSGRPVTYVSVGGPAASSVPNAMVTLKAALGLAADAPDGTAVRIELPDESVNAVVDYNNRYFLGLRSEGTLFRFYGRNYFGGTVDAAHHYFTPGIDEQKAALNWQNWLDSVYA
ncbi:SRPBCC family protein [Antrihabitans cavernicola]|uniref:SRPBCC domain-containing protein n=1 Tax=Antrihabitans cavernicola TaxID=2495913 RepID=A0A5A7S315_9NOCA|nr:SRPBCC domain-containing protein [Spelaeibacter cavernicola]KAA0017977.1 SRPBCC domain-containing protein [Spelaeibacter cavernicola]